VRPAIALEATAEGPGTSLGEDLARERMVLASGEGLIHLLHYISPFVESSCEAVTRLFESKAIITGL